MKSAIYALLGVSSLVTVLHINQFNVVNVNVQLPAPQPAATTQPSPPAPTPSCGSEYECQRIEKMKKLAEEAEQQCATVARESMVEKGKLVKDTIATHSEAVKTQEIAWHCKKD